MVHWMTRYLASQFNIQFDFNFGLQQHSIIQNSSEVVTRYYECADSFPRRVGDHDDDHKFWNTQD